MSEFEPFVTKQKYLEAIGPCIELAVSRNQKYGNSIDVMRDTSILDLCTMKLIRTAQLAEDDPKYIDEIQDTINYLTFVLMRRKEEARV